MQMMANGSEENVCGEHGVQVGEFVTLEKVPGSHSTQVRGSSGNGRAYPGEQEMKVGEADGAIEGAREGDETGEAVGCKVGEVEGWEDGAEDG